MIQPRKAQDVDQVLLPVGSEDDHKEEKDEAKERKRPNLVRQGPVHPRAKVKSEAAPILPEEEKARDRPLL